MKQKFSWHQPLAILTITTLTWVECAIPKQATANPYNSSNSSIEITVPPPQQPPANPSAGQTNQPATSIPIHVPPPESSVSRGICENFADPAIGSVIDRAAFSGGKWGVVVQSLANGKTLYSHNPNSYLIPASNVKILTTAAALYKLSPNTSIRSKSLQQWIQETNQRSNNRYADTLFRYLGGSQAIRRTLTQLGVNANGYRQYDGSGLSRRNLATPTAMVETLKAIYMADGTGVFYKSLPVAGVSGTLRNRLRSGTTQGKIHAKTGTLRGVRALSGYLEHPEYGTIVFSIMVNQSNQSGRTLLGGIDEVARRVAQLTPCS